MTKNNAKTFDEILKLIKEKESSTPEKIAIQLNIDDKEVFEYCEMLKGLHSTHKCNFLNRTKRRT